MVDDKKPGTLDVETLFDDVLKVSGSASQFGPLRIYRVPETPSDDFGRNGDLAVIDNTAESTIEISIDRIPTNVAFCQKVPINVPSAPTRTTGTVNGADLTPADQFTVNGTTITITAGTPFTKEASEEINAAAISGITASYTKTSAISSIVNPVALPGDSLTVNGVVVSYPTGGSIDVIIAKIKNSSIPFIHVAKTNNVISFSHTSGGVLTIGGASFASLIGSLTFHNGQLRIDNEDGTSITLVDVVGTPIATMGVPDAAASPPTLGGTWVCFGQSDLTVKDHGVVLGTFDTIDFEGAGVTVADVAGEAVITIAGGGGGTTQNLFETVAGDSGSVVASTPTDTLNIVGGTGITTAVAGNTVTVTNTSGALPPGFALSTINGQPVLTIEDSTRGNKSLSVADQPLTFSENRLGHQDWIQIGNANDADSGYISDLDGTIVYASAHCENTGANTKDIHLYVNLVDIGVIGTLSGGTNATFINTTLDQDVSQGDRIRLRAVDSVTGNIQDTVVKLTLKWRA